MGKKNILIARRKKKLLIRRVILATVVISIGGSVFLYKAPIFNIKNINVKGLVTVDSGIVSKSLEKYKGKNIFSIKERDVENTIKENPYIKSAESTRHGIATINIKVVEEVPIYYIKDGENKNIINKDGKLLESTTTLEDKKLVQVVGLNGIEGTVGQKITEDQRQLHILESFAELISKNESPYLFQVIDVTDVSNIKMYINNFEFRLGDESELVNKMNIVFNTIAQQNLLEKKGYLDVSSMELPVLKVN